MVKKKKNQNTSPLAMGRQQKGSAANKRAQKTGSNGGSQSSVSRNDRINQKSYGTTRPNLTTRTSGSSSYRRSSSSSSSSNRMTTQDRINQRSYGTTNPNLTTRRQMPATSKELREQNAQHNNNLKQTQAQTARDRLEADRIRREQESRARRSEAQYQKTNARPTAATAKEMMEQRRAANKAKEDAQNQKSGIMTDSLRRKQEENTRKLRSTSAGRLADDALKAGEHGFKQAAYETGAYLSRSLSLGLASGNNLVEQNKWGDKETAERNRKRWALREEGLKAKAERQQKAAQDLADQHKTWLGKNIVSGSAISGTIALDTLTGPASLANMGFRSYESSLGSVKKKVEPLKKQLAASGNYSQEELDEMFKDVDTWDSANAMLMGLIEASSERIGGSFGLQKAYTRGGTLSDRVLGKTLSRMLGSKVTNNVLFKAARSHAEESLEEDVGGIANALVSNALYNKKLQDIQEDAIGRQLDSLVSSPEASQLLAADLNSEAFINHSKETLMALGASKKEADEVSPLFRDYLTAVATKNTEEATRLRDEIVNKLAGGEASYLEKYTLQDALDARGGLIVPTLLGLPGEARSAVIGNEYKKQMGIEKVRGLAETVKNLDGENSVAAQAMQEQIDKSGNLTGTQVSQLMKWAGDAAENAKKREETKTNAAERRMREEDLRIQPMVVTPAGYELGTATEKRFEQIADETFDRIDSLAVDMDEADQYAVADVVAAFETGTITAEQINELNYENTDARKVFESATGIDLDQFNVTGRGGYVDEAASNVAMQKALFVQASQNYVESARIEQANWNDTARGEMAASLTSNLEGKGDVAVQSAIDNVDPRDKGKFILTGQAARRVYEYARNTNDEWTAVRQNFSEQFKGVDMRSMKGVFDAAKEDKAIAEQEYYGKQVKAGEKNSLKNAETVYVPGKFINESKRPLKNSELSTLSSTAASLGLNVIMTDDLERDENGRYMPKDRTIMLNSANTMGENLEAIFSHEVTHHLAAYSPNEYIKLSRLVMDRWYKNNEAEYKEAIGRIQKLYKDKKKQNLSPEQALEEIIANNAHEFWNDERFAEDICREEPSLAEAIINAIRDFLSKLRAMLASGNVTDEATRQSIFDEIGIYDDAYKMYLNAYTQAVRNRADQAINDWQDEVNADLSLADYEANERFSIVEDPALIKQLDADKHTVTYRAMAEIDGKLYPPMSTKVRDENGKWTLTEGADIGQWVESDITTNPKMFNKEGKFLLKKDIGGNPVPAAYNPYIHSSDTMLNDQFEVAYKRPNMVVVEGEIPDSELTNGYRAEHDLDDGRHVVAKDTTGKVDWKAGVVQGKLTGTRTVFLTNHFKPTRIVPDSEVAESIREMVSGEDVAIPYNVVTPKLRSELQKLGVRMEQSKQEKYYVPDAEFSISEPKSASARYEQGYKLTQKQFRSFYSAHKLNLRGQEDLDKQIADIKENGFRSTTALSNVMPVSTNDLIDPDNMNIMQSKYGVREGETVLLVPNKYVDKDDRIIDGYVPRDYEVVTAERDYQPYYELYSQAYDESLPRHSISDAPSMEELDGSNSIVEDDNGDPIAQFYDDGAVKFSISSIDNGGWDLYKDYLNKMVKSGELSQKEADDMLHELETTYDICKRLADQTDADGNPIYAPYTAWSYADVVYDNKGKPVFSAIKKNSEYKMNIDFSTICKKRRTLDAVFKEMIDRGMFEKLDLNKDESAAMVVNINNLIRQHKFEAACALCFVEARRYRQQQTAKTFTDMWNSLVESMYKDKDKIAYFNFGEDSTVKDVPDGIHTMDDSELDFTQIKKIANAKKNGKPVQTAEAKAARLILNNPEQRKLMRVGDMMASTGFENMQVQNPDLMKVYNSKKGTGGAKSSFGDVQYLNEIIRSSTFDRMKAYAVSGVRIQSFSDYVPRMVFDYVQVIADLAAKKLPAHAYTKEKLFVYQFGLTGAKINLSLVPDVVADGIAPGLDANGNYIWNVEGTFPYEEAMEIQQAEGYKENCGTIAVGISDEQIRKMLADPTIQMVIPYHKSSLNPIVAAMTNVDRFTNYEDFQNTKDSNGKAVKKDFDWDKKLFRLTHNAKGELLPKEKWGDVQDLVKEYVEWCEKKNYTPKFSQFLYMEDGSINPGYYKLLEDFALLDNDGNFKPQGDVQMRFPTEESAFGSMEDLIKQGLSEDADLEAMRTSEISGIVDEIEAMFEQGTLTEQSETSAKLAQKFSISPEMDADYMSAVNSGNMEEAQRLVDEAAKSAGYDTRVYHGTGANFTVFDITKSGMNHGGYSMFGKGFYFSDSEKAANAWGKDRKLMHTFIKLENPFDASGEISEGPLFDAYTELRKKWFPELSQKKAEDAELVIETLNDQYGYDYTTNLLKANGYDGVVYNHTTGSKAGTKEYVVFEPENIKSADSITYDIGYKENGNRTKQIIPLSERFNPDNNDIRYSLPTQDSDNNILSDGQMEYFKNSQARDEQGRLVPVYHGTFRGPRITTFDGSNDGYWFTSDQTIAEDYSMGYDMGIPGARIGTERNPYDSDDKYFAKKGIRFEEDNDGNWSALIEKDGRELHWGTAESKEELIDKLYERNEDEDLFDSPFSLRDYYPCYLNLENPKVIECNGTYHDDVNGTGMGTRDLAIEAKEEGYDGIIFRNIKDPFEEIDVYVAFSSNQIKDIRNQNPTENPDIRYSIVDDEETKSRIAYEDAMDNSYEALEHYEQLIDMVDPETYHIPAFQEENVARFYAALKGEETVPSNDPVLEEDRVRIAKSKAEFYNSLNAKWQDRWTTGGEVLDIKSVKTDIRNLVIGVMNNSDTSAKYRNDIVKKTLMDVRTAFQLMKQDETGLASYLLYHSAQRMIDNVEFYVDGTFDMYKDLKDYLRTAKISLGEEYWSDVDYNEFRKRNFGRLKLVKGRTNVDEIYQELQEMWPEWFNEDETMTPPDQLLQIEHVLDSIQPYKEAYSSEAAAELAFDIANDLYEIMAGGKEVRSLADTYKEKYDAKTKAMKQRHAEAMLRMRKAKEEGIQAERAKWRAREEKRKERTSHNTYFDRIQKTYGKLKDRLLFNTAESNIPEQYKKQLAGLLAAFDLQTEGSKKREAKTGHVAQKTIKMAMIREALKNIENKSDLFHVNDAITDIIDELMAVDGQTIDSLSAAELQNIDKLLRALLHEFNTYRDVRIGAKRQQAADLADAQVASALEHAKTFGPGNDYYGVKGWVDKLINMDEMTPAYMFKRIDPENVGLGLMWKEIRRSQDRYIKNTEQLNKWMDEIVGKYHNKGYGADTIEKWRSSNYTRTYNLENGTIALTPAQAMSLYCLSKRPQAYGHMVGAGVVVAPVSFQAKIMSDLKRKINRALPVILTDADIKTVVSTLTPEQIQIADQLQELMATKMADWGNEASMNVLGIKLFTEPEYFPIKSDKAALEKDLTNEQVENAIRNFGFTKAVQPGARNAIMVDDIFDVVTEHCNNMNLYNAYSETLNDFMKVYNKHSYQEDGADYSVAQAISHAYSQKATTFIMEFIRDLNGNTSRGRQTGIEVAYNDMLGKAKQASVFANLRVLAQQPTAITRAFAVIDPKYIKGIKIERGAMKEMFEHCPIALWKSWGYYDINMGKSIEDIIMNEGNWLEDFATQAYGAADNITWTAIWQMVKNEMKDTHPDVKAGTDEYWELCNERMSEIVDLTQVVDSPLHRSHAMRDKGIVAKTATAFMAEPTLTFNMFKDGIVRAKEAWIRGDKTEASGILGRTVAVFLFQAGTVAAAAALVDALRHKQPDKDDEDDRFLHLWWINTIENFKDNLKLWNNIYYVKDIASLFDGWGISNLGLQGFKYIADGYLQLTGNPYVKSSKTWYENMAYGFGYMTGIPTKTIMTGITNAFKWLGMEVPGIKFITEPLDKLGKEPSKSSDKSSDKKTAVSVSTEDKWYDYGNNPITVKDGSPLDELLNHFGMNLTAAEKKAIAKDQQEQAMQDKAKDIHEKYADLSGSERDKKVWSAVSTYFKDEDADGKSFSELVADGDYVNVNRMRRMYLKAGGDLEYFNERVMKESKSALKKSIKYDQTEKEIAAQENIKDYLLKNGLSEDELSEIVYKSDTAKDVKVAMRLNDDEALEESLIPLINAGLTYDDYERLWDNRNRMKLSSYKGRYKDRLKSTGAFIWPTQGTITSHFGYRDAPTAGASSNHPAIDIGAAEGTDVVAADGGTVIYAGWNSGYGNSVGIQHDNGMVTYYNHLSSYNVNVGDSVSQGQLIAAVGSTGISTGPHLDFKILDKDGNPVDPEQYLS